MTDDHMQETFKRVEQTIQQLVASKSNEEAKQTYAEWQTYDDDLDAYGYVAPQIATELLTSMIAATSAPIYDAGCGSGKVGKLLAAAGYNQLTGADLSESMLQRARKTGVYRELKIADFSTALAEQDEHYEGLISVGVWNDGFGENLTREMLRITKPGAAIVFSVRPQFVNKLQPILNELEAQKKIASLTQQRGDYITGQGSEAEYIGFHKQ